jgi:hypothetical protein
MGSVWTYIRFSHIIGGRKVLIVERNPNIGICYCNRKTCIYYGYHIDNNYKSIVSCEEKL